MLSPADLEAAKAERDPSKAPRNTPLCESRLKKDGEPTGELCQQIRGWGTTHPGFGHCKRHGGSTKAGKKFAAEQMARELVEEQRRKLRLFGGRNVVDPEQVLLEEMQRSHAIVRNIEQSMAEWQRADYVADSPITHYGAEAAEFDGADDGDLESLAVFAADGRTGLPPLVAVHKTVRAVGFTDTEWAAWIKVLREERRHLVQVAKACIDAEIVERRQRMLEANATFMRRVMEKGLELLGVKADQAAVAEAMQASILHVVKDLAS